MQTLGAQAFVTICDMLFLAFYCVNVQGLGSCNSLAFKDGTY